MYAIKIEMLCHKPIHIWALNKSYMQEFIETRCILHILKPFASLTVFISINNGCKQAIEHVTIIVFALENTLDIVNIDRLLVDLEVFSVSTCLSQITKKSYLLKYILEPQGFCINNSGSLVSIAGIEKLHILVQRDWVRAGMFELFCVLNILAGSIDNQPIKVGRDIDCFLAGFCKDGVLTGVQLLYIGMDLKMLNFSFLLGL